MDCLKKVWVAAAGAALGLAGIAGFSIGVAGASSLSAPASPAPSATVDSVTLPDGTYAWYLNGVASGTITFLPDYTFTSTDSTDDTGDWVEYGKDIALSINGGSDTAEYDCVFAGKVLGADSIGNAAKPGRYSCPGTANGTFYVLPQSSSARPVARGNADDTSAAKAPTLTLGKYNLFVVGQKLGYLNFAKGNVFTSDVDPDDAGSWVTSDGSFAMTVTSSSQAPPNDVGCLFVGHLTSTGVNSAAAAAPYVCGGVITNAWWAKEKS